MSDFKFACPGCGQRIAANDDYTGQQINCPACHAPIIVPPNPAAASAPSVQSSIAIKAPPGMPPPPAPPKVARLSVAGTNSNQSHNSIPVPTLEQQGSAVYRAHMANKPGKSYKGLIIGLVAVALIGVSAWLNWGSISGLFKSSGASSSADAAAPAATNTSTNKPQPQQQELTAREIMKKVSDAYRRLPSFACTGKIITVMDLSAVNPALAARGPQTISSDMVLKMTKPDSFRINLTLPGPLGEVTMTGWSVGSGDQCISNNRLLPVTSRDDLFNRFDAGMGVGPGDIVRLFTDDTTAGLAKTGMEWTLNNDDNVDHSIDGQACYVLAGTVKLKNVLVWVDRNSFLIPQLQIVLGGIPGLGDNVDDDQIKDLLRAQNRGREPSPAQVNAVKNMAKVKGYISDTFANIQTNLTIAMADLQPPLPAPKPTPPPPDPNAGRATSIANGAGGMGGMGGGGGGNRGGGGGRRR